MPEIISRYPEVTLKVLKEAGAKCGEGLPQKILTKCPEERFCSLPTGETCVYGVNETYKASQFSDGPFPIFISIYIFAIFIVAAFIIGIFAGRFLFIKKEICKK